MNTWISLATLGSLALCAAHPALAEHDRDRSSRSAERYAPRLLAPAPIHSERLLILPQPGRDRHPVSLHQPYPYHDELVPPAPVLRSPSMAGPGVPPGTILDRGVPTYHRVKVKDRDNIAPRAVPVLVAVRDPGACDKKCTCCVDRCVFVEICVPPCPPDRVRARDNGSELKLDFGKHSVEVEVKKGTITVDYDD